MAIIMQLVPDDATMEQVKASFQRQTGPGQLQAPTHSSSGTLPSTAPIRDFQYPSQHQRASFPQSDGYRPHRFIYGLFSRSSSSKSSKSGSANTYGSYNVSGNKVLNNSSHIICPPHHSYRRITCNNNTIGPYSREHIGVDGNGILPPK